MRWAALYRCPPILRGVSASQIRADHAANQAGWQRSIGDYMAGKILGIIGLGNVGSGVAKVGLAFGMNVTAWSQNLTSVAAEGSWCSFGIERRTTANS